MYGIRSVFSIAALYVLLLLLSGVVAAQDASTEYTLVNSVERAESLSGNEVALKITNDRAVLDLVLPALGGFGNLRKLDLAKCELKAIDWASLQELNSLSHLALGNVDYNEQLSTLLPKLHKLESLSIDYGTLSEEDAAAVASSSSLQHLSMRNVGYPVKAPASLFPSKLTWLQLSGNEWLTTDLLTSIANCLSLEQLYIDDCSSLHGVPESLGSLTKLAFVKISRCTELTKAGVAPLVKSASLRTLIMGDTNIEDAWLDGIGSMKALEYIDVQNSKKLTDVGLRRIGECPKLKSCTISGCPEISGAGFSSFTKHDSLEILVARRATKFDDDGVAQLLRLTKIREVSLDGCPLVTDEALLSLEAKFPEAKIMPPPGLEPR